MSEETTNASPPKKLPKLRAGISLRFNGYDHDGIPQWLIFDSGRNNFFVIGWPDYEMLSRWDMDDPNAIINAVNNETTTRVEMQDFEALSNFLSRNYLVEQKWSSIYQRAKEQKLVKSENILYWLIRYYLFFRIPLFHPDKFLTSTKKFGDFLFNRYTGYVMIFLGAVAIFQIGSRWQEFIHTFSTIFTWQGLVFYFIAFTIAKFFHELGHAYMCKQYGVPVPTMGVAFLVFWPVLYTDTTLSWSLPSHQRLRIALAGMWVETYVTIIAALIWCNVHNVTIQMICYVTVAINWVSTLLINVSPFMRFDGYYVLSDLLKMPNLQNRSFTLARWQIRNWLFGWEEPVAEQFSTRMHWVMVIYAIITWCYRLVIYFGIAILVYHYFFKVIGIILFVIELFAFILRPFVHEVQTWIELKHQFTLNRKTITTLMLTTMGLFLLLLPLSQTIKLNATLSYNHEFLFAEQEGVVENKLPPVGTQVVAGQLIVKLKSAELEYNIQKTKLEYEKVQTELRRAALSSAFASQTNALLAELTQKKSEYNKLIDQKGKLELKAPFTGQISDVTSGLYPGVAVMKNKWILDIIDPTKMVIEAFADQADIELIKTGSQGDFYPVNIDEPKVAVTVVSLEPINSTYLASRFSKELKQDNTQSVVVDTPGYHSSELGGKIPTNLSEKGEYVPIQSVYRVLLTPDQAIQVKHIGLGVVVLTTPARSFVYKVFYKIKSVLVEESGF